MNSESDAQKDYRFTKWMAKNVGVLGIPPSAFFNDSHKKLMETFVRYCFVKRLVECEMLILFDILIFNMFYVGMCFFNQFIS